MCQPCFMFPGDLWGPFLLYVSLALYVFSLLCSDYLDIIVIPLISILLLLSRLLPSADKTNNSSSSTPVSSPSSGEGPEFATVFVLASVGSMVVTANTQLLGGSISFFQSLCVLGYCVLPLFFSLCGCRILMLIFTCSHLCIVDVYS